MNTQISEILLNAILAHGLFELSCFCTDCWLYYSTDMTNVQAVESLNENKQLLADIRLFGHAVIGMTFYISWNEIALNTQSLIILPEVLPEAELNVLRKPKVEFILGQEVEILSESKVDLILRQYAEILPESKVKVLSEAELNAFRESLLNVILEWNVKSNVEWEVASLSELNWLSASQLEKVEELDPEQVNQFCISLRRLRDSQVEELDSEQVEEIFASIMRPGDRK